MESNAPVKMQRRGKRSPTGVWIQSHKGARGKTYRVRYIDPTTGKTQSEAAGHDLALARMKRDQKREELRQQIGGRLPDKTLSDLIAELPKWMAGRAAHTIEEATRSLKSLKTLCGDKLVIHIGRSLMLDFRAKRINAECTPATVNKDIRQVSSALSYAADAEWIRANPLLRWRKGRLTEPEKVVRVLELEEFAKLLTREANPDPVFRVLLITGYYQGLRRTELANLRWEAVDLAGEAMHIVNRPEAGEFTKTRKNRTIPMHPIVHSELTKLWADVAKVVTDGRVEAKVPHVFTWGEGQKYRPKFITRKFTRCAELAGVKCTIHDLRRSFSTMAQRAGVQMNMVVALGGWSCEAVVRRHYTGSVQAGMRQAMDIIARGTAAG